MRQQPQQNIRHASGAAGGRTPVAPKSSAAKGTPPPRAATRPQQQQPQQQPQQQQPEEEYRPEENDGQGGAGQSAGRAADRHGGPLLDLIIQVITKVLSDLLNKSEHEVRAAVVRCCEQQGDRGYSATDDEGDDDGQQ